MHDDRRLRLFHCAKCMLFDADEDARILAYSICATLVKYDASVGGVHFTCWLAGGGRAEVG